MFTDAQKAGNFSNALAGSLGNDAQGRPVPRGQIYDPFSVIRIGGTPVRDPFPGNIIPASRINPIARTMLALSPSPNGVGTPNYVKDISAPLNIDTFVGRVDFLRSRNNTVFGHFVYSDQSSVAAAPLGLPIDGGGSSLVANQRQFGFGWTSVLRPTVVNEFRLGYARNFRQTRVLQDQVDLNSKWGIPYPFPGPDAGGSAAMVITGFTNLGTNSSGPFFQPVNKYEIRDNFTVIRGSHTLGFGVQSLLKIFENQKNCNQCRGQLTFDGVFTSQPGFANTGSAAADFLLGTLDNAILGNVSHEKDLGRQLDWWVQDKWIVSPKLTVTLGLRYQFEPPSWENRDIMSNVLFQAGSPSKTVIVVPPGMDEQVFQYMKNTLLPTVPVIRAPSDLGRGLVRTYYKNFGPRLGVAYRLGPKTVLDRATEFSTDSRKPPTPAFFLSACRTRCC